MSELFCAALVLSCLAACDGAPFQCGPGPNLCIITGNEPSCPHPNLALDVDLASLDAPDAGSAPDGFAG